MSKKGRFIAYYRVSTQRQGRSGLGLDAQRQAVTDYLGSNGWELLQEFTEVESGRRADRPELDGALKACKKRKARLVIAKLDRLARNVAFIAKLMESGVDFVAADLPQANKLTIHIMAAMAEYERDMISSRTKAALAAAKLRGVKLGGPKIMEVSQLGRQVQVGHAMRFAANVMPIIADIRKRAGITSLSGIAAALNAQGVPTARGGRWAAQTVKNVLARA
ncbi:MAG: recombinase family protein [Desulfarculaceae bacterium]|nr:recombinase family protein [Desulfarculaceae bacterium]MCF8045909.1 recombinase family protein [Desulfarculaceae bacterium]MCF8097935.1 recombinase family protein [Desulfarculaceae bacterium]MCF8121112.1 recombinase family protein [Desulfarculaceae bacterium]